MEVVLGPDISAYQGDVNFVKMQDAGAGFVICRKQIGYYGDTRFFEYAEAADKVGLPLGAYGVPFPGYSTTRQFHKFIEGISPDDLVFPPFPDVEKRHNLTLSRAVSDILDYSYALKNWWGHSVFYTAKYVWQDYYSKKKGWVDDWELWVANYMYDAADPDVGPDYLPIGWEYRLDGSLVTPRTDAYVMWQWSADHNQRGDEFGVSSRDIDLNWMDKEFYDKYVIPVAPPEENEYSIKAVLPIGFPVEVEYV